MRAFIFLADHLHLLAASLGIAATTVGALACPLESLDMQHGFLWLSAATACAVGAMAWHVSKTAPNYRIGCAGFGVAPLVFVWLILLCQQPVREGSARFQMISNGKQILLGAHDFHDGNHKRLPVKRHDAAGKPTLSWRVSLCPYMDQPLLLQQFDPGQTWDSPRNQHLVAKIPVTYQSVLFPGDPGETPWQGFVGPGTAFEPGNAGLNLERDFPDGRSYTILVVEAKEQVPWSAPADIPYGPGIPLPSLGERYPRRGDWPFCCPVPDKQRFVACMADGSVRMFSADIAEDKLRALIERNDGRAPEID